MKIAVIGAGAMGSLYGGYLSRRGQVTLIDSNAAIVKQIAEQGLLIQEADGREDRFFPRAQTDSSGMGAMDLVLLFVKSMYSRAALDANRGLLGENTYLMTLQNGAGHETLLREYAPERRIIIGTTPHNCALLKLGAVRHGGSGATGIGLAEGDSSGLKPVAELFEACGFPVVISDNIQRLVWEKLFVNASVSVLTGVLQTEMGFMADNPHGRRLIDRLIAEAVAVASADGHRFDCSEVIAGVHRLVEGAKDGITSICADLRDGRRTEVDAISGAVVRASRRTGVPAPAHEFIVELVHAMEDRGDSGMKGDARI